MRVLLAMAVSVAAMTLAGRAAEDDAEKTPESRSPGGRFVFRKLGPELGYGVVERKSGRKIVLGEEAEGFRGVGDSAVTAVWEAGGSRLAVNYRAGGRYNTTQLYVWTGEKFADMQSVEDVLTKIVAKDRAAFLKKEKLPADKYLRRIWDTYRTLRWVDERTVEVYVESTRTFLRKEEDDEPEDITVSGVFTVRYDKTGKPKIIGRREPTKKEDEAE